MDLLGTVRPCAVVGRASLALVWPTGGQCGHATRLAPWGEPRGPARSVGAIGLVLEMDGAGDAETIEESSGESFGGVELEHLGGRLGQEPGPVGAGAVETANEDTIGAFGAFDDPVLRGAAVSPRDD